MFLTIGFVLGSVAGWVVRSKLDGLFDIVRRIQFWRR